MTDTEQSGLAGTGPGTDSTVQAETGKNSAGLEQAQNSDATSDAKTNVEAPAATASHLSQEASHAPGLAHGVPEMTSETGVQQGPSSATGGQSRGTSTTEIRAAMQRRTRAEDTKSSELLEAERETAHAEIKLSPEEERDIRDSAESQEDAAEMREEIVAAKRKDAALNQAKSRVNPAVPRQQLANRPAFVTTSATIEFHMREAFAFTLGRSRRPIEGELDPGEFAGDVEEERSVRKSYRARIVGLFEAAKAVNTVVQGHIADCPYATWFLFRIEEEIAQIRQHIVEINAETDALVKRVSNLEIAPLTSRRPSRVSLTFRVPYAYHFADLLKDYDNMIRKVKALVMLGFIQHDDYRAFERRLGTPLRRLFRLPTEWSYVGRSAVIQKTAELYSAEHKMGTLPERFVQGEVELKMVH